MMAFCRGHGSSSMQPAARTVVRKLKLRQGHSSPTVTFQLWPQRLQSSMQPWFRAHGLQTRAIGLQVPGMKYS